MNDKFEKFTERARKVLSLAQDEARRLNHHYIGTEHLLLGLVREGEGIAAGVLESLGINLEKVRTQTIQVLSQGSGAMMAGNLDGRSAPPVIGTHIHLSSIPSRNAAMLPTMLSAASLLLLGVGVTQMANNTAYGMAGRIGLDIIAATALLGGVCVVQSAGMLLIARLLVAGYALTFAAAVFWIVAGILDRAQILSATAIYHDSMLSQTLSYTTVGLGILIVVSSVATPLTVSYGSGRQRGR